MNCVREKPCFLFMSTWDRVCYWVVFGMGTSHFMLLIISYASHYNVWCGFGRELDIIVVVEVGSESSICSLGRFPN